MTAPVYELTVIWNRDWSDLDCISEAANASGIPFNPLTVDVFSLSLELKQLLIIQWRKEFEHAQTLGFLNNYTINGTTWMPETLTEDGYKLEVVLHSTDGSMYSFLNEISIAVDGCLSAISLYFGTADTDFCRGLLFASSMHLWGCLS